MKDKNLYKYSLWVVFCISALFFLMRIGYVGFEVNDDQVMAMYSSGFLGVYDSHMVHNNIILGWIISQCSRAVAFVNWNTLLNIGCILISYIIIGVFLIYKKGFIVGVTLAGIVTLATFETMLHRLNFSKTGALTCIVGIIILSVSFIDNGIERKKRLFIRTVSGLFILIGSLFRCATTISLIPFAFIAFLLVISSTSKLHQKEIIITCIVIVVSIMSLWGINSAVYSGNSEWKEYREFNKALGILDYYIADYNEHREVFEGIGWSENDYNMFRNWSFADNHVFNVKNLKTITEIPRSQPNIVETLLVIVRWLGGIFKRYPLAILVLLMFSTYFVLFPQKRFFIVLNFGAMCGELIYLCYKQRCPERAVMIPILCAMIILIFIVTMEKDNKKKYRINLALLCYSLLFCGMMELGKYHGYQLINKEKTHQFLTEISQNVDELYVWSIGTVSSMIDNLYEPIEGFEYGLFHNSVLTGGWPVPSPTFQNISAKFGENDSVFKLLAENEQVFLVDTVESDQEQFTTFIREHYNMNAECKLVKESNGYYIYSFCTDQN